jgi:multicomponent K+:H+ antiporter subunit E
MKAPPSAARRLPPVLIVGLVAMWLLLNQSLALGHVLLGTGLACSITWWSLRLRPLQPRLRNLHLVPPLVARVLVDVVQSNVGVARVVLGLTGSREVHSGFLEVPLELKDAHGLAVLAAIFSATPGTVWVDLAPATNVLTLHVLDLQSEEEWRDRIKRRYEEPLLRIFQ